MWAAARRSTLSKFFLRPRMAPGRLSLHAREQATLRATAFECQLGGQVTHGKVPRVRIRAHGRRVSHLAQKRLSIQNPLHPKATRPWRRRLHPVSRGTTCVWARAHTHPPIAVGLRARALRNLPHLEGPSRRRSRQLAKAIEHMKVSGIHPLGPTCLPSHGDRVIQSTNKDASAGKLIRKKGEELDSRGK